MSAHQAGFEIRVVNLGNGLMGLTDSESRIIWLDNSLCGRHLRSTLAHEVVHARLGHGGARGEWHGNEEPWLDGAVDVLAAGMLFSESDFAAATEAVGRRSSEAVARRLGIDRQMLAAWHRARKASRGEVVWLSDSAAGDEHMTTG